MLIWVELRPKVIYHTPQMLLAHEPMVEYSLRHHYPHNHLHISINAADGIEEYTSKQPSYFKLLRHSANFHREVRPTNRAEIGRSLRTLAAFTEFIAPSGIEWYLSGGIGIDLVKKSSFREHGDLDVILPIEQAERLNQYLHESKVASYRRVVTSAVNHTERLTLFRNTKPHTSCFGKRRTLKLFLQSSENTLPLIDIHFVVQSKRGTAILSNRDVVWLPFPLRGDHSYIVNGEKITCCDLRLILYLKSDMNPRNFKDAQRIAQELSNKDVTRVLRIKRDYEGASAVNVDLQMKMAVSA